MTEIETEMKTEDKPSRTARFAEWLMARDERRQEKESNLEGLMKLNVFLSVAILIAVAGSSAANYALMAWAWL